jgi:UDP-4-amino-4,6-dideoxy-N-acetyl-beta-L-altrosamine transaminase
MNKLIPYGHQYIDSADVKEVMNVLSSDWITQGPKVKQFEDALCKYTGVKYAVAVSSGTAALHLSMMALGIGKENKVITSPITFSASANCAIYVKARPLFIDIDDQTYHLDTGKLRDFLRIPSCRKQVKVIIPVHFMGTVADIAEIKNICDKYGIKVVEDAAHALGAKYKFKGSWVSVGSCIHSDAAIFSFHPIKHITTGEGGAVLTNSKKIYEKALRLRQHGIIKKRSRIQWSYDISEIGFNYRLTDFQCALGISQLKKINKIVSRRRELVSCYNEHFSKMKEIKLPYEKPGTFASYHLYVIRDRENKRNDLYNYLRRNGILSQVNYIPIHLLSYYKKNFGYRNGDFLVAEKYFKECLSLPLYFGLTDSQQKEVINRVKEFYK